MKKVYIYTEPLICRRRALDAKKISEYFLKNHFEIVNNPKDADIIIYFTCASADETVDNSMYKINEFKKYKAELIVAGCLPVVEIEKLTKIFNGKTLGTKDINQIDVLFPENKIKFNELEDANILFKDDNDRKPYGAIKKIFWESKFIKHVYLKIRSYVLRKTFGENSFTYMILETDQFHIRISWGCPSNCSYCTIKKSTGTFHSKPLEQCIDEFKKGLSEGHKSFIITADNTGAYGIDIGSSFSELLDKLTQINGEYKLSIRDFDPRWLVRYIDDFEEIFKKNKVIILDVPIQSASERILKLMNRYSDVEKMKDVFIRLKSLFPNLTVCTHVIVGFPTETIEDLKKTFDFITEVGIDAGQVFPFSVKEGTEAERIEPKIPKKVISERMRYAKKYLQRAGYNIHMTNINTISFDKKV